ncbi:polysaccharide biosynthesis/export family protein [Janthinobacterium sp. 17J80-10]|uniref:polysaccharide biosynthesis/export family protein n=1 Tax=Janthinobacterium sp. 17J80-10 TaxID=2497863 RepID=UPI00100594D4|nr:polysaccharide biosynthesis/export family protein [Janthinobacterium sp. 17J80-10]QAU35551.1 polysaccharide export protein [Janthinobacterium sp. 17J80-10]
MKPEFLSQTHFTGVRLLPLLAAVAVLTGCAMSPSWLPSSGPNYAQVDNATTSARLSGIQIVDVNDKVTRKLLEGEKRKLFSESFGSSPQPGYVIGSGDVIEVSVWEAPPAALFGGAALDVRQGPSGTRITVLPEQMVSREGSINVPFAGQVPAARHTPRQIETEIVRRLKGKANQPQVLVRVIRNNTANVTIVGEVANSTRMPITDRGERLLDALAVAGGVRQPINKVTMQLTRGNMVHSLPLDTIIRDPKQNIVLQPGDVLTSLFQPLSFTVLGAAGKNAEVDFEAQGISLTQALARAGGVLDSRADAQGVFIFRFEPAETLDWGGKQPAMTPEGTVPVIYRVDLKDPATFFVAQSFPIRNKDVMFVSNAPAAELQKFLNIVGSVVYPIISIQNATN